MNDDRRSFLKMLGIGAAGLAVSQINSAFTPDIEKDIEAIKQKLSKQLNVNVSLNLQETKITTVSVTHREVLNLDIDDNEKVFWAIQNFIDPYFNSSRKKNKLPEVNLVEIAIKHLKHYQSTISNGFTKFYLNEFLGACYLLLEDFISAQTYFENILSPSDASEEIINYRLNTVIDYYNFRNIPFPTNFKFKK